jgi:hypothetical protein
MGIFDDAIGGLVQAVASATGAAASVGVAVPVIRAEPIHEQPNIDVPPLLNPEVAAEPRGNNSGNGATVTARSASDDERLIVLPEQLINDKLAELHARSPALRRINFRKDGSSIVAILKPFRIFIPRGETAANKGILYLVLRYVCLRSEHCAEILHPAFT